MSQTQGIEGAINSVFEPIANAFSSVIFFAIPVGDVSFPLIVAWLIAAAAFFTVYLRFLNVRAFSFALKIASGQVDSVQENEGKGSDGEISHFQALTTAVSGTVGLGNIAGVAVAIGLGGPGAIFWMVLVGFLGMSTKMAECTLGVLYRQTTADGTVSGGPMYYLSEGFARRGQAGLGKGLAIFCSIMLIGFSFGAGCLFQVNQSFQQVAAQTPFDNGFIYGTVIALFVGAVIIGGIKSIGRVTATIVPFMCGIYVITALAIVILNITEVPGAILTIIKEAFVPTAVAGGFIGAMIQGFRRAAFSNEAGCGSASIAHSAVKTKDAATQGLVAMLEPFIDTVLVCSATGIVIVLSGAYTDESLKGISLTSAAFESVFWWGPYMVMVAAVLFAVSTMISWSYYGVTAFTYVAGQSQLTELAYKVVFCGLAVVGGVLSLGAVVDFSDAMIFAMTIPNIIGLYVMAPEIKAELQRYLSLHAKGLES
ncbi:MAG: alanine/glycine:cation symporter family protein [Pseudomonadota bacterium]